jgi:hypothetical protein
MFKNKCYRKECTRIRSEFSIFMNRKHPPQYEGNAFCSDSCLWAYVENELTDKWRHLLSERDPKIPRPKLGTILMQTARLTRDQVDEAIKLQSQTRKGRIGEWLLRLGFVEEHQVTAALALQYGLPTINLRNSNANVDALRMIPGKVAKCSSLIPVGFDGGQGKLRVAVSAPINNNYQESIRRMVRKGMVVYIGDQSAIQQLQEKWYEPEDLDIAHVPTYGSAEELVAIGNEMIATAINQRALDIRAELFPEFFWMRLDFPSESHHHLFRYVSDSVRNYEQEFKRDMAMDYAAVH